MIQLRVGDRVYCAEHVGDARRGMAIVCGTVIGNTRGGLPLVEFDMDVGGHDGLGICDGVTGKYGHCLYVSKGSLEPIVEEAMLPDSLTISFDEII